ncbi:MAG: hypothetical protein PHY18_06745, partial [Dehalococcoidales bacterium]|nr:hypothetical protein [Dehalococcoidales bacterium]
VGHRQGDKLNQYLPPQPARIHGFIYLCSPEEVREFSQSFAFLNIMVNAHLPVSTDELISAALRQMSQAHRDPRSFLIAAGKELALLIGDNLNQLKAILKRIEI